MAALRFDRVTKTFPHHRGQMLLRDRLLHIVRRERRERFVALDKITFKVEPGECLAVVGPNGAGKSTLLNLAAGLARPDSGVVEVRGQVSALLELGTGFHPDLTGAENVRINAALMGFSRRATGRQFDAIVDFAGVREFLHQPLRTWSAGMQLRLAFAVAVSLEREILIVDEVIAVGDQAFQAQCLEKIQNFRRAGKTILMSTHSQELVRMLADRALWLERGLVKVHGETGHVLSAYHDSLVSHAST